MKELLEMCRQIKEKTFVWSPENTARFKELLVKHGKFFVSTGETTHESNNN